MIPVQRPKEKALNPNHSCPAQIQQSKRPRSFRPVAKERTDFWAPLSKKRNNTWVVRKPKPSKAARMAPGRANGEA